MTAEGFTIGTGAFLSSSAEQYFKKHKQLPPRGLTITKVSTPAGADSFQNLLQAMAQSKLTRFLVYAHGQSDGSGLYLRLATRRGLAQGAQATFNVINSLISLGESGKPATDRQLNYLQITQAELATIVALRKSIRGKNIECIEFRGCNLGRNATSAASFKKFFGAKVFGAPDFYSFFGRSTVHIGATYVDRLKKSRTSGNWHEYVYAFQQPEGTLTNHILTDGDLKPTEGYIIADSVATVQRWVKSYIDAAGGYEASDGYVLLHGMWDTGKRKIDVNELENMPIGSDMKTLSPAIIMPIGSDDFKNHVIYV